VCLGGMRCSDGLQDKVQDKLPDKFQLLEFVLHSWVRPGRCAAERSAFLQAGAGP
jgi:hypothetical protein